MNEFEFESSVICQNTSPDNNIVFCDQPILNKTNEMQKLNLNDNLDCTGDEKAIAEALENESFNIGSSPNCDANATTGAGEDWDKLISQPLSFHYGRHIVQSVESDDNSGSIYLQATRDEL